MLNIKSEASTQGCFPKKKSVLKNFTKLTGKQLCWSQKQPPDVYNKKIVLKNFTKFTGKR